MVLRQLAADHLSDLAALCARGLRDDVAPDVLRRLLLDEPQLRPELQLGLWDGPALAGVALGSLRELATGLAGGPRLLLVAPELRGQGHGRRLLEALEQRLVAAGARELRVGALAPNYLWPGLDPRDTAALCLFERSGYRRTGDAVNMEVDLAARDWWPPAEAQRMAATSWSVRRATASDGERLAAWVQRHFATIWVWELRQALGRSPVTAFLAEGASGIGGFACHSVSGLAGTFGPTGTDPALRGQGLGRALLLLTLADLREQGFDRVEIGWVGPVGFYSRMAGAAINRVFWFLARAV